MAIYYLEHGKYSTSSTFTGYISGTVLTVTGSPTGKIGTGATITGAGIIADTIILSVGTGTGGAGTYNINYTQTVASSGSPISISSTMGGPSLIPSWGVAQDGDGIVNGLAVSAIGSILFNATDTTGSITIMGVSISITPGASVSAMADSLAASINGSSITVTSLVSISTPQLRDLVYARGPTNGAPSGTCQIMTRAGSNTLNYSINPGVVLTPTITGTALTTTQFSGGVSGSWGWFVNNGVFWPSAKDLSNYGILWGAPLVGDATGGDTVHIRTTLNGSPIYIGVYPYGNPPANARHFGVNPIRFIYNSNDAWAETNGRLTIRITNITSYYNYTQSINNAYAGGGPMGSRVHLGGVCSTDSEPNVTYELLTIGYSSTLRFEFIGPGDRHECICYCCGSKTGNEALQVYPQPIQLTTGDASFSNYTEDYPAVMDRCLFIIKQNSNGTINSYDNSGGYGFTFNNCTIRGVGITNIPSPYGLISSSTYGAIARRTMIRGLKLQGIPANTSIVTMGSYPLAGKLIVEDTSLTNLESTQGSIINNSMDAVPEIIASGSAPGFPFILENNKRSIYWLPTKGQPALNALTPDGFSMSWAVQPATLTSLVSRAAPIALPKMGFINQVADGVRTFTLNFLADKAKSITSEDVYTIFTYVDAITGIEKTISTNGRNPSTFVPVVAGTPDWSQVKNDGTGAILPFMTIGSDKFYYRYQMVITTPTSVKQNTVVNAQVYVGKVSSSITERFIFCPEIIAT